MDINFINLKAQYEKYKAEIDKAILDVLDSTHFIMGKSVKALEKELSEYTGAKHCIACSSGTDALLLCLMAIDIKPGDEVITTPFSFIATAEVIALLKAVPIFVDIEADTYNIDASLIEAKITKKTKAIIPVGIFGQVADMDEINVIAKKHKLYVIEDAAQSFGAKYKGKRSCNLANFGCTSFFPAKPLGCYGDGGAVFTNDDKMAVKLHSLMNHGQGARYHHKYLGINGRLDEIQAAILRVKLAHFNDEITARQTIADRYAKGLKSKDVTLPTIRKDRTTVHAQYSIRVNDRAKMVEKLSAKNIPTAIHYPVPLYKQEVFKDLKVKASDFPVSEKVSSEIMSLAMSPFLSEEEQNYIMENI